MLFTFTAELYKENDEFKMMREEEHGIMFADDYVDAVQALTIRFEDQLASVHLNFLSDGYMLKLLRSTTESIETQAPHNPY